MQLNDLKTIGIELKMIEDFFLEPDYNPFDSESRFRSGIDELVDQVGELSMKEPLKISVTLTSPPEDAEIEAMVKNALSRYCSVKIRECEQAIYDLRSQGKRDLVWALSISFILILGAFFTSQMSFLPQSINYFLETGLGIMAWVILWPPLDSILYEWRPCRRSQRIYKHIQSAKLVINPAVLD